MKKYILSLDQGTTSSRAVLFDISAMHGEAQGIACIEQKEYTQIYKNDGWVEHDPAEIYSSQMAVLHDVISKTGISAGEIAAIGITNQRETTIVWEKETGKPVYNAIVWQCRRTAGIVDKLTADGMTEEIRSRTGLVPDAYFSATKIAWILDNIKNGRERARAGELLFGTVDTWLLWNMTGGKVHATDYTNASRTMLFNIHTLTWDETLLAMLDIPLVMLPQVRSSSGIFGYFSLSGDAEAFNHSGGGTGSFNHSGGRTETHSGGGRTETHSGGGSESIPIASLAGDQQAALFGQCCFEAGDVKNTYGTGCFLLMNTGEKAIDSKSGLITTLAAGGGSDPVYALEGSVFSGGLVVQWLRDEISLINSSAEIETYAGRVADSGGVYFVPAFTGLGTPYWDMYARGCIIGLTRATTREHILRAALESIAYQSNDMLRVMQDDTGMTISQLRVDGGACVNNLLMQFQADISNIDVMRPVVSESTALGAAYLAGLAVGVWKDTDELKRLWHSERVFKPQMDSTVRDTYLRNWSKAVGRSLAWVSQ